MAEVTDTLASTDSGTHDSRVEPVHDCETVLPIFAKPSTVPATVVPPPSDIDIAHVIGIATEALTTSSCIRPFTPRPNERFAFADKLS